MTHDEARTILEAIQEEGYDGNDWEREFLESFEGWVEDGKKITDKQSGCLQAIYRKATGG